MTNREKYEKEIIEVFWKDLMHPAVTKNGIESCDGVSCNDCLFSYRYTGRYDCDPAFRKWLTQEYKEPEIDWTKVPVDTKILVKDKKEDLWINSHFAYYKDGKPYAFFLVEVHGLLRQIRVFIHGNILKLLIQRKEKSI